MGYKNCCDSPRLVLSYHGQCQNVITWKVIFTRADSVQGTSMRHLNAHKWHHHQVSQQRELQELNVLTVWRNYFKLKYWELSQRVVVVESMAKTNEQGLCSERCKAAKSMMLLSEPNLDKYLNMRTYSLWHINGSTLSLEFSCKGRTLWILSALEKNVFENKIMIVLLH